MTYKIPNRKKPRVKIKRSHVMNPSKFCEFKKKYPEHSDISLFEFNKIIRKFNNNVIDEVVNYRYGVSLPERLGILVIVSFPSPKKKIIDFGTSNKTGVLTYHKNWETDNRLGKIAHVTEFSSFNIKYSRLWGFTPNRFFKKKMIEGFKKSWEKYIFIDNTEITIKKMLR